MLCRRRRDAVRAAINRTWKSVICNVRFGRKNIGGSRRREPNGRGLGKRPPVKTARAAAVSQFGRKKSRQPTDTRIRTMRNDAFNGDAIVKRARSVSIVKIRHHALSTY